MAQFLQGPAKYAAGTATGLAAGFVLGLVGWGGAQIIKPSLTQFVGLSTLAANGTSLTSLSVAATMGAARFGFGGQSDLATAACIAIPSMAGARFGVVLAQKMSSEALALVFNGVSVILIPSHFFVQKYREQNPHEDGGGSGLRFFLDDIQDHDVAAQDQNVNNSANVGVNEASAATVAEGISTTPLGASRDASSPDMSTPATTSTLDFQRLQNLNPLVFKHIAFGSVMGVVSALMGVGGAPLCMSYLTVATDLPHHLVQGTMMVAVLPAVLTSAASLAVGGHTPLLLAASVCAGSGIGSYLGAETALHLSESTLRSLYMGSLVLLGSRAFIAAIGNVRRLTATYMRNRRGGGPGTPV